MPEEARFDVKYSKFAIDEQARCYWDTELSKKNLEFIHDIDPGYFYYVAQANRSSLDKGPDARTHAAMAIRLGYHHGIETLFALIFAGLQAPDCVIGWLQQYAPRDLRPLVGSVGSDKVPRYLKIRPDPFTWEGIAKVVFSPCYVKPNQAEDIDDTVELFRRLWSRLAKEFVTEQHTDEYNSIKHGLRLKPGATEIRVALQEKEGEAAPFEQSVPVIVGTHGNTFYVRNEIAKQGKARHLSLRNSFINWDPEGLCEDLELISVSIHNVRTWLLVHNNYQGEQLTYKHYTPDLFRKRLQTTEISWGSHNPGLSREHIKEYLFDEDQILEIYPETT